MRPRILYFANAHRASKRRMNYDLLLVLWPKKYIHTVHKKQIYLQYETSPKNRKKELNVIV